MSAEVDLMHLHEFDAINHPTKYLTLRRGVQKALNEGTPSIT